MRFDHSYDSIVAVVVGVASLVGAATAPKLFKEPSPTPAPYHEPVLQSSATIHNPSSALLHDRAESGESQASEFDQGLIELQADIKKRHRRK